MKIILLSLIALGLVIECYGCFGGQKSDPEIETAEAATTTTTTTSTTTTTTTTNAPVEKEIKNGHEAVNTRGSGAKRGSNVDAAELRALSEELYLLDRNSVGDQIQLNLQGQSSPSEQSDVAPQPLFKNVNPQILNSTIYRTFMTLLDNYVADVRVPEDNPGPERSEIHNFLNAVAASKVMKRVEQFLTAKGLITEPLLPLLQTIWFTPYTRQKGVEGSSGFEHVFLGEIKDGKVSGFHNWLFFEKEEKENDANYKGYIKNVNFGTKGEILKMNFEWMNRNKEVGSMFVGTSPELEMALYTVCFYARPNAGCNLQMNNQRFRIKVYEQTYQGKKLIGSAYPEIF